MHSSIHLSPIVRQTQFDPFWQQANGELMREAIEIWTAQVPNDTTPPLESIRQKDWYRPIVQSKLNSLLNTEESIDRARLHGFAYPGAGDWLNVLPSNNLGLALTDHQFSIACPLRLGAPVSSSHKCECGVVTDRYGSHQLVCPKIMSCFARHQLGDDVIYDSLRPPNIPASLELVGLFRNDGRRPDGATLVPWGRGRSLAWDYTCVHRLAESLIRTCLNPGDRRRISKTQPPVTSHHVTCSNRSVLRPLEGSATQASPSFAPISCALKARPMTPNRAYT